MNYIDIVDTDNIRGQNDLRITLQEVDSGDCWWYYYYDDLIPPRYWGDYRKPDHMDCSMDLQIYIEVYESVGLNIFGGQELYECGVCAVEYSYCPGLSVSDQGVWDLRFDLVSNGYQGLFYFTDDKVTQWHVYGERRSLYDVGGDMVDFMMVSSHGYRGKCKFYYGGRTLPGEPVDLDDGTHLLWDEEHYNGDRIDFQATTTCTEAEGNDEIVDASQSRYIIEGIGSDGFDLDTEWLFLFPCSVLMGYDTPETDDSNIQTLLWHGMHGVFGNILPIYETHDNSVQSCFFEYCWGLPVGDDPALPPMTVYEAWDHAYRKTGLLGTGAYYYHLSNAEDYLWGCPSWDPVTRSGGVTSDVLARDDIRFVVIE